MRKPPKSLMLWLFLFSIKGFSQSDSTTTSSKRKFYLPAGITSEFAGGFGVLSTGILFHPLKKAEFAVTVGYTPPSFGNIWTVNALLSYTALKIKLNKNFSLHLLKAGGFVNFNFGKNIYLQWPSHYPDDYYWWNSAIRLGPFVDTELKYAPAKHPYAYTFFFQCSTNDIYIASYGFNRSSLYLHDIFVYGLGVKLTVKNGH